MLQPFHDTISKFIRRIAFDNWQRYYDSSSNGPDPHLDDNGYLLDYHTFRKFSQHNICRISHPPKCNRHTVCRLQWETGEG